MRGGDRCTEANHQHKRAHGMLGEIFCETGTRTEHTITVMAGESGYPCFTPQDDFSVAGDRCTEANNQHKRAHGILGEIFCKTGTRTQHTITAMPGESGYPCFISELGCRSTSGNTPHPTAQRRGALSINIKSEIREGRRAMYMKRATR